MERIVVASMKRSAGKTSLIVGMAKVLGQPFSYIKPFGDRLFYRKKRLWDYDSALVTQIFGLASDPEEMSIGFDHAKVRYMYDERSMKEKLLDMIEGGGGERAFIEAGTDLCYGASVHLDALSLARQTGGRMILVLSGDEGPVMDDLAFLKRSMDLRGVSMAGVIVNKTADREDFEKTHGTEIASLGFPLLGVVPFRRELTYITARTLAERLFVKIIAGEEGLGNVIRNIFIGAMNAHAAQRDPLFRKEGKLLITSGDRSDMIVAGLESDTAGILITNNIVPPPNIIARSSERKIPLLLVSEDTFQVARQVDCFEPLLTRGDGEKIALMENLVREYVSMENI